MPISIYEPGVSRTQDGPVWHRVNYTLASENAERIGIEHVAQMSSLSTDSKPSINKQISGHLGAVNMLQSRLEVILDYVEVRTVKFLRYFRCVIAEAFA